MLPEIIAFNYILSPQYMQDLYPETGSGLYVEVNEGAGCLKIGQALYKSCGTTVRQRYTAYKKESPEKYRKYLKDLANTNIDFSKKSQILEDYCDISEEIHIDRARKNIFKRANVILDYANNY